MYKRNKHNTVLINDISILKNKYIIFKYKDTMIVFFINYVYTFNGKKKIIYARYHNIYLPGAWNILKTRNHRKIKSPKE